MCGRYSVSNPDDIYDRFDIDNRIELSPRYNVAPSQEMPVIDQPHHIDKMQWGLIPFWAKEAKIGYSMINAKAEGIADKPSYRKPFRYQRCIIPADGFFEWKQTKGGKIPHYFKLKNGELFGFAGLYDIWKDPKSGHEVKTYTIITTTPNEIVREIHNRMPVILRKDEEQDWLNPDTVEPERLEQFLKPYPATEMEDYEVSSFVNSPGNDSPEIIQPQVEPQTTLL